jgi:urate oxidase
MHVRLTEQRYGKSSIYLTKVTRHQQRHDIKELAIDVALEGDFSESYVRGANHQVVATDTMKNTVFALAAEHPLEDAESFVLVLAGHFLDRIPHVTVASVTAAESPWQRIDTAAGPHANAFIGGTSERRTCSVRCTRDKTVVKGGIAGLALLKTTNSAFRGFRRDEFTTLAETDDRIFATQVNAEWTYYPKAVEWNTARETIRDRMVAVFADHMSLSVQQTLFAMGEAAMKACPSIAAIHLEMPNRHRLPINLELLGKENRNEIFVATCAPYGLITATLERENA